MKFSPDGRYIAVANAKKPGAAKGALLLIDAADPTRVRRVVGGVDWVVAMAFSPDGQYLAATLQDDSGGRREKYTLHIYRTN
jgi:Tol biopolymer transport system component